MAYAALRPEWAPVPVKRSTFSTKGKIINLRVRDKSTPSVINEIPTYAAIQKVQALSYWATNWDGRYVQEIQPQAIARGKALINELYEASLDLNIEWLQPSVTASSFGEVVFEWWNRQKKLTIYVGPHETDYVKVWGADIEDEMETGALSNQRVLELLQWLEA